MLPKWPRGRGIAETFGFLAQITLLVQVGSYIVGHVFPNLDPGEPRLYDLGLGLGLVAVFGSVWLGLRSNRLWFAQIGIAATGATLLAAIFMTMVRNMQTGESVGGFEGLLLYGFGSLAIAGCGFAMREVRAESARRAVHHA